MRSLTKPYVPAVSPPLDSLTSSKRLVKTPQLNPQQQLQQSQQLVPVKPSGESPSQQLQMVANNNKAISQLLQHSREYRQSPPTAPVIATKSHQDSSPPAYETMRFQQTSSPSNTHHNNRIFFPSPEDNSINYSITSPAKHSPILKSTPVPKPTIAKSFTITLNTATAASFRIPTSESNVNMRTSEPIRSSSSSSNLPTSMRKALFAAATASSVIIPPPKKIHHTKQISESNVQVYFNDSREKQHSNRPSTNIRQRMMNNSRTSMTSTSTTTFYAGTDQNSSSHRHLSMTSFPQINQQPIIPATTTNTITSNTQTNDKKFRHSLLQLRSIMNLQSVPLQKSPEKQVLASYSVHSNSDKISKEEFQSAGMSDENIEQIYEQQLRREIPNAFSDAPATRQDVAGLKKWMNTQITSASKQPSKHSESAQIESVLALVSKELLRQIQLECNERGDLLASVIDQWKAQAEERVHESRDAVVLIRRQFDDNLLLYQSKFDESVRVKDATITMLNEKLANLSTQLHKSEESHSTTEKTNKQLHAGINKLKETLLFIKRKLQESNWENEALRAKLNKAQPGRSSITTEEPQIKLSKQESSLNNNTNGNTKKQVSIDDSINSDLFGNIENHASERQIEIEGVSETIDNLNYVPFTNPDDVKKQAVASHQTGNSLLIFSGIICEQSVQTDLNQLVSSNYDTLLADKSILDVALNTLPTIQAQVDYLKQRERQLLQQIETLKMNSQHSKVQQLHDVSHTNFSESPIPSSSSSSSPYTHATPITSLSTLSLPKALIIPSPPPPVSITQVSSHDNSEDENANGANQQETNNDINAVSSEDEFDPGELKLTKNSTSKSRQALTGSKSLKQSTNMRQLGQKTGQVDSLFNEVGSSIVEKVRANKFTKFRNFMPLPTVMKQINLIYLERIRMSNENAAVKEQECSNFTYYFLTKLYGFKKIVDQKFIIFILSVKKYLTIFRVHLFAKFIGLFEVVRSNSLNNLSLDEFNKYIEVLNYVHNVSTVGIAPSPYDHDNRYLVPFIRIMAFIGNFNCKNEFLFIKCCVQGAFADTRMTSEENGEFRKEIELLKESDPRGIHTLGLADFDVFVSKMLQKYRQLVNRAKNYVINAFAAADLDGNGVCNLDEFLILNRHIEGENYDEEMLVNIFVDNADKVIEGHANLTFDRFAIVCVDHNLFSEEAQDAFLQIRHKREISFKMQELQAEWDFRKRELLTLFDSLKLISIEQKNKWLEIIDVLCQKLQSVKSEEMKPLLLAYRILQNESRQLLVLEDECRKDEDILDKYEQQAALSDQMMLAAAAASFGTGNPSGIPSNFSIDSTPNGRSPFRVSPRRHRGGIFQQQRRLFNMEGDVIGIPASDSHLVEQAYNNLSASSNRKEYLLSILASNGIHQPSKRQNMDITDLLEAFDAKNIMQAKNILFSFLKSAIATPA